jgi:hypothetical protein
MPTLDTVIDNECIVHTILQLPEVSCSSANNLMVTFSTSPVDDESCPEHALKQSVFVDFVLGYYVLCSSKVRTSQRRYWETLPPVSSIGLTVTWGLRFFRSEYGPQNCFLHSRWKSSNFPCRVALSPKGGNNGWPNIGICKSSNFQDLFRGEYDPARNGRIWVCAEDRSS